MVKQTTFWRCMQVNACDNDTDGELDGVHMCVLQMHALLATNSYIGGQVPNVCILEQWMWPGVGVRGNLTVMGSGVLATRQKGVRVYAWLYVQVYTCVCTYNNWKLHQSNNSQDDVEVT